MGALKLRGVRRLRRLAIPGPTAPSAGGGVIFPDITVTTATIDNAAAVDAVVFDLPALAVGEKRSFIASSAPDLVIGSSGKVLRGLTQWAVGRAGGTAVIRQEIAGQVKDTPVTVTTTASAANPNRWMFASTRTGGVGGPTSPADTQLSRLSKYGMYSPDYAVPSLRPVFANFGFDGGGGSTQEVEPTNAMTIDGAVLAIGTSTYPITFNGGSSTVSIPAGGVVIADPVVVPGGVPARTKYFTITSDSVASGQQRSFGYSRAQQLGDGLENTATPQLSKLSATASIGYTGGTGGITNTQSGVYGPVCVLSQGWDGRPAVLIHGDSMIAAANDAGAFLPDSGCSGFGARGFDSIAGGAQRYPHLNLGLTGSRASQMSTRNAGQYRRRGQMFDAIRALNAALGITGPDGKGLPPFTAILSEHINNDTGSTAGNTDAGLRAVMQTYWNFLRTEYPEARLIQTSAMPNAQDTTGNRWTTYADQTLTTANDRPSSGLTSGNMRWGASDWFMANKPAPLDAVLNTAAFFAGDAPAPNNAKWRPRTFTSTLAANYTSGASTISLVDRPEVGELILVNPGGGAGTWATASVSAVSGTGPYTCTLGVSMGTSFTSGQAVKGSPTTDGAHASVRSHIEAGDTVIAPAKLAGVFGVGAALVPTFTLDPAAGKTLAGNFGEIPDGAICLLKAGDHGNPTITGAKTAGITVVGEAGAVVGKTTLSGSASKWTFKGVKFRSRNPGYDLTPKVYMNDSTSQSTAYNVLVDNTTSNIVFDGCAFCSAEDSRDWTPTEWIYYPRLLGLSMAGTNNRVANSKFYNLLCAMGLGGIGGHIAEDNYIEKISVDGIRFSANNLIMRRNVGRDHRHKIENFPILHADWMQGYGSGGGGNFNSSYSNILIEDNDFDTGSNTTQGVQGISSFDGLWTDLVIRNNKVKTNAPNGIVWFGVDGLTLDGNTLSSSDGVSQTYICATAAKNTESMRPPKRHVVKNNKTDRLMMFAPGVYASIVSGGLGYTTASTLTFGPPTQAPNVQAIGNVQAVFGDGALRTLKSTVRAPDSYTAAPTVTLGAPGSGANVVAQFCSPDYYMAGGVSQVGGNTKVDGSALTVEWIDYVP